MNSAELAADQNMGEDLQCGWSMDSLDHALVHITAQQTLQYVCFLHKKSAKGFNITNKADR